MTTFGSIKLGQRFQIGHKDFWKVPEFKCDPLAARGDFPTKNVAHVENGVIYFTYFTDSASLPTVFPEDQGMIRV